MSLFSLEIWQLRIYSIVKTGLGFPVLSHCVIVVGGADAIVDGTLCIAGARQFCARRAKLGAFLEGMMARVTGENDEMKVQQFLV